MFLAGKSRPPVLQDFYILLEVGFEPTLPGGNRILSPLLSQTGTDTEEQGETKLRFCRGLGVSGGTGRESKRYPVAVRIAGKS